MSFLRSLFSGVSGLRNHQTMMDVIGNNIANINTVGFKAGRATFAELYAQTLRGAGRPVGNMGGTNPMQVGLGITMNTLDTLFTQGNIETTGQTTDLAIQGSAFFIVNKDGKTLYTRAGTFAMDATGKLVNPGNGAVLQGKMADASGVIAGGTVLQDITIPLDSRSPAKATTMVKLAGNLDSSAVQIPDPANAGQFLPNTTSSLTVYDSLGNKQTITVKFYKQATANTWSWTAYDSTDAAIPGATGTIVFNPDGTLNQPTTSPVINWTPTGGAATMNVTLDIGTATTPPAPGVFAGLTQTAGSSTVTPREQDGYSSGSLSNISIDTGGRVLGTYTNGTVQTLAQVMLAEFSNPSGLVKAGENTYDISGNSGTAAIVNAGENSKIVSGALEQSNVDLADEFTKMITAQRGFQANARVITTSDEFLQEVVNLKR